jgi:dethiobiotin synthetase
MTPLFVTGIGTGIGKTLVSAILAEALEADYWKPIQAGIDGETDSNWIKKMMTNKRTHIHPETYLLKMAASPHIAAREEKIKIELERIRASFEAINANGRPLIIEGAGGLLVPLNEKEFVSDLIKKLQADVILVSRNYLGSINHSLLTASVCRKMHLQVRGWVFNDQYLNYEQEIVNWSGYRKLGSVPKAMEVNKRFVQQQAELLKTTLI